MELNFNPLCPDAEWGFQAQHALEKLLNAELVLQDRSAQRTHALVALAEELGEILPLEVLQVQVFAVEARYEEAPFPLQASRGHSLNLLNEQLGRV